MNKSFKLLSTNVDNNNVQINKVMSESVSVVEENNSAYAKYGQMITELNSKFSDANQQFYSDMGAVGAGYNEGMGEFVTVTDDVVKNLLAINSLVTDSLEKAVDSTKAAEMVNGHLEQLHKSLSSLSQGIKEFEGSCSSISSSQEQLLLDYSQAKKTHEELNLRILGVSNKVIEGLNNKLSNL
jgi:phage shock protein A